MRARGTLVSILIVVAALLMPTQAANAASAVRIVRVNVDSPGSDTGSNGSLNYEAVFIKNFASYAVTIAGWQVRDNNNYTYVFKSGVQIGPGATLLVHTGQGTESGAHKYYGRTWYIWNNTGDKARLINAKGTLADDCAFKATASYVTC